VIKVALAAALMFVAVMPGAAADAAPEKAKSETVYALLKNDGTYTGATVVNRFSAGGEITDYGVYTSIENLMGPQMPDVNGDVMTWPASVTGSGGFFYQGETDKALPIRIGITYYLNGILTAPEDIAGQTGQLRIAFDIDNMTTTGEIDPLSERELMTPFAVQVSLSLDTDMFTVTDIPENASSVTAGSSCTVSYTSFPLPDDDFSFTVFGQNMTLEPINIIALPKAPPGLDAYGSFVDVDGMRDGTDEMIDGTDDMRDGADTLQDALYDMKDAAKALLSALGKLESGAGDMAGGVALLRTNVHKLAVSADEFAAAMSDYAANFTAFDAGMAALEGGAADITATLQSLEAAAGQLDTGLAELGGGIDGVTLSNAQLAALADAVAATYPDADTAALAAGLATQQAVIDAMASSCGDLRTLSDGLSGGIGDLYAEFSVTFAGNVAALRASSGLLYDACLDLLSAAGEMKGGCASLAAATGDLKSGAEDIEDGFSAVAHKLPALLDGIDDMIEGVGELDDGLATLGDDGLVQMRDSFDGLEGYLQKLSDSAAAYSSFIDARNTDSTVQFVLKTQGIG
jgi:hypothetical protein